MIFCHSIVITCARRQIARLLRMGYNDPAARGMLGLMSARVTPKLSEDCRLRNSRSPRTVLVARGRTLNPVCREQQVIMTL